MATEPQKISTLELLLPIDNRTFSDDEEFQDAVVDCLNRRLNELPPNVTHWNVIAWARKQGWLKPVASGIRVDLPLTEEMPGDE